MFEVEDPVVKITDDEEMVLFAVTIFELVVEGAEDTSVELTEDTVEVVDGATLLVLLELLGASLILRAPLTPLLETGLPSFFFM
jgi:hypothetical protein